MDDIFCDDISRCSLCTKHHGDRGFRLVAALDIHVFVNSVQGVHLLAFVLMKTFYLYIDDGIFIQRDILCLIQELFEIQFAVVFDLLKFCKNLLVVFVFKQFFQLVGIFFESRSDQALNILCQFTVAVQQPAAESDSVCLVVEFLRINIIERFQLGVFQDLGVQCCNAVNRKSVVDIHVCHVDALILVDDRYFLIFVFLLCLCVQLVDNRHQVRNNLLEVIDRPFFQCLCQNGVVGVSTGLAYNIDGFLHGKASLLQQTDQLRNDHGRMSIVDLDHNVIIQLMQIVALLLALHQDELCAVADHEILLVDTKQLSGTVAVIRVEEQCQVFLDLMLVKVDAV